MDSIRSISVVGMFVAALAVPGGSAGAFERTMTCDPEGGVHECEPNQEPKPLYWPKRCVRLTVGERAVRAGVPQPGRSTALEVPEIVRRGMRTWNGPDCSDLTLVPAGELSAIQEDADGSDETSEVKNEVRLHEERWPYMDETVLAFTSTSFDVEGALDQVTIAINALHFDFAAFSTSRLDETSRHDLENTITHELGHFIGLDHVGAPEATMHGSTPAGEIAKRTLSADEVDGLCTIYPGPESEGRQCDDPEDFLPPSEQPDTEPRPCGCRASRLGSLPESIVLFAFVVFVIRSTLGLRRSSAGRSDGA